MTQEQNEQIPVRGDNNRTVRMTEDQVAVRRHRALLCSSVGFSARMRNCEVIPGRAHRAIKVAKRASAQFALAQVGEFGNPKAAGGGQRLYRLAHAAKRTGVNRIDRRADKSTRNRARIAPPTLRKSRIGGRPPVGLSNRLGMPDQIRNVHRELAPGRALHRPLCGRHCSQRNALPHTRFESLAQLEFADTQVHVMSSDSAHVAANVDRFSGFAELYDQHRPRPPELIVDLLTQLAAKPAPVVVDIGSGSGLSTVIWTNCAAQLVGVEPNADMRAQAERRAAGAGATDVRFIDGLSTATGLPDRYADIVTCSQSLHWMEPQQTFTEIARILRDGGVFAAYDCDFPPTFNPQAEQAYNECRAKAEAVERAQQIAPNVHQWNKNGHLERMKQSGRFRYVKEVVLHHVESGGAERLVGLALSQGEIASLLRHGISEDEIGITALRVTARRALGDAIVPWYWSYSVRLGVK
jgi:ubiquinone/menaquinone biosynthesis C-methylase UbiE